MPLCVECIVWTDWPQVTTRVAALTWINMLHEKDANEMNKFIGDLLPALLKTLSDTADEVVLINLQVHTHTHTTNL